MDLKEYQEGVLLTESDVPLPELAHFQKTVLTQLLKEAIELGKRADTAHRALYYGEVNEFSTGEGGGVAPAIAFDMIDPDYLRVALGRRLLHVVLGLIGEAGELTEILYALLLGETHVPDLEHIAEELGDAAWYLGIGADATGYSMHRILAANLAKLRVRHKNKFDRINAPEAARDRPAERRAFIAALEQED